MAAHNPSILAEWTVTCRLDTPSVWTPDEPTTDAAIQAVGFTALTGSDGIASALAEYGEQFTGYIRVHLDPERFSAELEPLTLIEKYPAAYPGLLESGAGMTHQHG